jgi:hypothetical protein
MPAKLRFSALSIAAAHRGTSILKALLETYLHDLAMIRGTGVPETSGYPALSELINALGLTLRPKVRCIINPANAGAGIPDGGFFTPNQLPKGGREPLPGLLPERGALEVKALTEDMEELAIFS